MIVGIVSCNPYNIVYNYTVSYLINHNFLEDNDRARFLNQLNRSDWWGQFEDREAFTFTYKKRELPCELKAFETDKHNLYQFVAIRTTKGGAIDEHIDNDFSTSFLANNPEAFIGLPETTVYYVDIDKNMEGGSLIVEDNEIAPETNMAVILSPGCSHSVTNIKKANKPRVAVVCEKYYILSKYLSSIKTPNFRKG